jgi:hypothetical protein
MKTEAVLGRAIALGPFLTSMPLSREANVDEEGSRKVSVDTKVVSDAATLGES